MRAFIFALLATAACGDNLSPVVHDDAGVDAPEQAVGACIDRPDTLERAPTGQLPCELLPPGFTAP